MGKVPAIRYGDTVVTETAAIVAYLADMFPAAGLAPLPTDARRGAYFRWLFFGAGPLEAASPTNASASPFRRSMPGSAAMAASTR